MVRRLDLREGTLWVSRDKRGVRLGKPDMGALAATHAASRRLDGLHQVVTGLTGGTDKDHVRAVKNGFMEEPRDGPSMTTI